jgi:hypothetical protein
MLFAVVASLLIFTFYEEALRKHIRTRFSAISRPVDNKDRLSAAFAAPTSKENQAWAALGGRSLMAQPCRLLRHFSLCN